MNEMYAVMDTVHNHYYNMYAKLRRYSMNIHNFDTENNEIEDQILWEDDVWNAIMYFMEEDTNYYDAWCNLQTLSEKNMDPSSEFSRWTTYV